MNPAIERLSQELLKSRKAKGLSQRDLSRAAGIPQGHISRIESGTVDVRISSLIEHAHALGLEVVLVPQIALPAVNSIVRQTTSGAPVRDPEKAATSPGKPARRLVISDSLNPVSISDLDAHWEPGHPRPAYRLEPDDDA
jgi:transcriptional regulator with XRE-family HTH domain|tara:strand:- start:1932 stop:2351 length:420 start_codon:yes stop_codon:yes gene_type:complete